jgi:hypothetical protein
MGLTLAAPSARLPCAERWPIEVGEALAPAGSGKFLMPVGGDFQRIPCDEHGAWLLLAVEAQQQVRKAKNGTGRLPAVP